MSENKIILEGKKTKKPLSRRNIITLLIVIILIPLTIIFGGNLGERSYYFISLLIIVYVMVPFFVAFEGKRPRAREVVVLAVMCAIAVVSRAVFIAVPHFKPMVGIIMITGAALGAEAGFLTGAISGFVSNFIFGQGPWTPWQMFAFGIAGFLAGILVHRGIISSKRAPFCIFGGIAVMAIVGPLLDTCSLFTMTSVITPESAAAIYLAGVPVNAIHSAATVLTILVLSKPMLEKLERIKKKYGMLEF